MELCILPVLAADALRWARGEYNDSDLASRASREKPEAVFIQNLPDLRSYRKMLDQVNHWRKRGAVTLVARTSNSIVRYHLQKNGCVATFRERGVPDEYRFLAPAPAFSAWYAKWATSSPSAPAKDAS